MESLALMHVYLANESSIPEIEWAALKAQNKLMLQSAGAGLATGAFVLSMFQGVPEASAVVKRGNLCVAVRDVQQALIDKGHDPGGVDGAFGGKTQYAVMKFQQRQKLASDGIVGPATAKALGLSGDDYAAGAECSTGNADSSNGGNGAAGTATAAMQVSTEGGRLNVRAQPNTSANILSMLENGAVVRAKGQPANGWVELVDGGWVSAQWMKTAVASESNSGASGSASSSVTVSTQGSPLNVRSQPNTSASILRGLDNGAVVSTKGEAANGWIELTDGGWISAQWVK